MKLKHSENKIRHLANFPLANPNPIIEVDANGTADLVEVNKQLADEILARKEKEKYIHARSAVLDLITKKSSRKDFLEALLNQLLNWTGCCHGGIRVLNEKGQIPYEAYMGFDKEFIRKENYLSVISDHCACIRAVNQKFEPQDRACTTQFGSFYTNNSGEFVKTLSEKEIQRFRGLCIKRGYLSIVVIPVRYKEKVVAAIHLADEARGRMPKETVEFIEHIATVVGEGIHSFNLQERVRQGYINQGIINSLLRLSLTDVTIEKILQKAFSILLSIKWLQFEQKGSIFLVEGEPNTLILKAQKGLHPYLQKECSRVQFGKCICGKAALSKKIQFIDSTSSAHEIRYRGMKLHSHYCVPIISSAGTILGVINIYLTSTYLRDYRKDEFLMSVANVLGTIIESKRTRVELRKTQNDLASAKRLSDIGTLAATVAHELRNPLAAIRMAAHNIKRKAENPALESHLKNIENKISESDQIINNLLFYSRIKLSHYEKVNLYEIIEESIVLAKNRFVTHKVKIKKELNPLKDVFIDGDSLQMKELFSNIVNNAYDALSDSGGRIEVSAEHNSDDTVKVHIKDNGVGIDKENLDRIFEPFFTTKSKGTGLGLSVCYQIINLHHGKIRIESEKGKGTTVNVILPRKMR